MQKRTDLKPYLAKIFSKETKEEEGIQALTDAMNQLLTDVTKFVGFVSGEEAALVGATLKFYGNVIINELPEEYVYLAGKTYEFLEEEADQVTLTRMKEKSDE